MSVRPSLQWQLALLAMVSAAACGGDRSAPQVGGPSNVSATLGGEIAARVGNVTIHRKLVLAVARARGVSASQALDALVDEALFAQASHEMNGGWKLHALGLQATPEWRRAANGRRRQERHSRVA